MTKDEAIERSRNLLKIVLDASGQGKVAHETRNRHDGRMLSDYIGDYLRETQSGFDDV